MWNQWEDTLGVGPGFIYDWPYSPFLSMQELPSQQSPSDRVCDLWSQNMENLCQRPPLPPVTN